MGDEFAAPNRREITEANDEWNAKIRMFVKTLHTIMEG